jgi:adenosylcobinamide-GDP ribazoletransferase
VLVFDILFKWACWYYCFIFCGPWLILWSLVLSRCVQALYLAWLPAARADGAASAFRGAGREVKWAVGLVTAALCAGSQLMIGTRTAAATVAVTAIVSVWFAHVCVRKIDGITGDCVGAASEMTELAVLCTGIFQNTMYV